MLTDTTSKSLPPRSACSASSAGISLRHGAHQVAQRLSSTVRPLKSARVVGEPSGLAKASGTSGCGTEGTLSAATSPFAKGESLPASAAAPGQAALSALRAPEVTPYTAATPT